MTSIDTGLLRPLLSKSGQTPVIMPFPRDGFYDSVENLVSLIFHQRIAMSKKDFAETVQSGMDISVLFRRAGAPMTNFPLANLAAFYRLFTLSLCPWKFHE